MDNNLSHSVCDMTCFCLRNLPFLFLTFWTGVSAGIISYDIQDLMFQLHLGMNVGSMNVPCLVERPYLRYCTRNNNIFVSN